MLMQVKLLRLIQERTFTRVGGETAIKTGARIICATNTDLEAAVAEGRFRQDLYYRINVIPIAIPPLRDRSDDILPLAQPFMREFSEAFHRDIKGFTAEAEQALLNHLWPGNVRQLRNSFERAVALSQAPRIGADALFPSGAASWRRPACDACGGPRSGRTPAYPRRTNRCRQPYRGGRETSRRIALDPVREDAQARYPVRGLARCRRLSMTRGPLG